MTLNDARKLFGLSAVVLAVAVGCAGAPTQEMSDARQAIKAAQDAGATKYLPESLGGAEMRLAEAEKAIGAGDYEKAKAEAMAAREAASKARNMAVAIAAAKEAQAKAAAVRYEWRDTGSLIAKAEEAARKGDEQTALKLAKQATQQSQAALEQYEREKDRHKSAAPKP